LALQAYIVVFSTIDTKSEDTAGLPNEEEIKEAFVEMLGIPDEVVEVHMWPATLDAIGYQEGQCRRCGDSCGNDRLFCNGCASEIAGAQVE
jgi:hypothetical protein